MTKEELIKEVVRLKKSVESLQEDSSFLEALNAAGVDNWDGYEIACDIFKENE